MADTRWAVAVRFVVGTELNAQVLFFVAHRLDALLRRVTQIGYQISGSGSNSFACAGNTVSDLFGGVALDCTTNPLRKVDGTADTERETGGNPKGAFHRTFDFLERLEFLEPFEPRELWTAIALRERPLRSVIVARPAPFMMAAVLMSGGVKTFCVSREATSAVATTLSTRPIT